MWRGHHPRASIARPEDLVPQRAPLPQPDPRWLGLVTGPSGKRLRRVKLSPHCGAVRILSRRVSHDARSPRPRPPPLSQHGRRRHPHALGRRRKAGPVPRREPAFDHPRRAIGRRLDPIGRRLGAGRPAGARPLRRGDERHVRRRAALRVRRCPAGERFHREGPARRPAVRTGHLLPRAHRGSRRRQRAGGADDRPLPHGARGPARRQRSSGPAIPPARAGASTRAAAA